MVSILLKIPVGKSVASGINSEKSLWEMAYREADFFFRNSSLEIHILERNLCILHVKNKKIPPAAD